MALTRIALATAPTIPRLPADEQHLIRALADLGVAAEPAVWSDPAPWGDFDAVVIRSCWDYHLRPGEFLDWISRLETLGVPLWNPPALVRWNADKRYLGELAARGIATVPTRWVTDGAAPVLADLLADAGWSRAIVKPTVSATSFETWPVSARDAAAQQPRFAALCRRGGVMIQPFLPAIAESGEWSLCFFRGAFSHAVLKRPAPGDFRVQEEFGGTVERLDPPSAAVAAAAGVLAAVTGPWCYARVDGCMMDGRFTLLELEMLEPTLYLDAPGAADRFAAALVAA